MKYFALISLLLLVAMVALRARFLKSQNIKAFRFNFKDLREIVFIPFVGFLFYLVFASTFNWWTPGIGNFSNGFLQALGVVCTCFALVLLAISLISFGKSFRIGLDEEKPGELVTTGIFAISRNPIYTAFLFELLGLFLLLGNFWFAIYLLLGIFIFYNRIRLEEESLKRVYGKKYLDYCKKVRRFI